MKFRKSRNCIPKVFQNCCDSEFNSPRDDTGELFSSSLDEGFRAETDQATRWMSFALLEVEKGFRRISGYDDMPELIAALEAARAG